MPIPIYVYVLTFCIVVTCLQSWYPETNLCDLSCPGLCGNFCVILLCESCRTLLIPNPHVPFTKVFKTNYYFNINLFFLFKIKIPFTTNAPTLPIILEGLIISYTINCMLHCFKINPPLFYVIHFVILTLIILLVIYLLLVMLVL